MAANPTSSNELPKSFEHGTIEAHWYRVWEERGYFRCDAVPGRPSYSIQLPPPNVTGTLHMGHAFQQTLMDALVRYHRMRGMNTNWIVGTDHAGIATQIVVERQLKAAGLERRALGREAFVERVWAWKEQSGSTITRQIRRLGGSGNWEFADASGQRAGYFTMDERMSRAVIEVFVRLYEEGLIYRGKRLVNWDPVLGTAVSDLEVESEEEDGFMWDIHYPLVDGSGVLTIATTRPETLLGDVAVAVHPEDERYRHLIGALLRLPLTDRTIPIIADTYVDPSFGTGCVKITPAHDFNDWAVGQRHGLAAPSMLTLSGHVSDLAPERYRGLERFVARERILEDLQEQGLLGAQRKHRLKVPRSERTGTIVEPMLTDQWFMKMDGMAARALDAVATGDIRFYPDHWRSTYNHWLTNIQDWCISRQLWWGHQIPAWYSASGKVFVARSEAEAAALAAAADEPGPLQRDADVLDTWFSSGLIPFSTLGWPAATPEMAMFLPSSALVTGFDIIFFWVARMIMLTLHFTDKVPFKDVYIHALIRDAEGQKMSKSRGNTLDPLDLIDGIEPAALLAKSMQGLMLGAHTAKVEEYIKSHFPNGIPAFGADALRFTFASVAGYARSINFDLSRCEGYRNFCNKLWNATRYVLMNCEGHDCTVDPSLERSSADRWIISLLVRTEADVARGFAEYRFDLVAQSLYQFVWDEYCDWYLELAKVQLQGGDEAARRATRHTLVNVLETVLRLLHPIIPFITEELWQKVAPIAEQRNAGRADTIMLQPYPVADETHLDPAAEAFVQSIKASVDAVRTLRGAMGLSPAARIPLLAAAPDEGDRKTLQDIAPYLKALAKLSEASVCEALPDGDAAPVQLVENFRLMLKVEIDLGAEIERLDKELERVRQEMESAATKLANTAFVDRAPQKVVEQERARLAQAQSRLEKLQDQKAKLAGPR